MIFSTKVSKNWSFSLKATRVSQRERRTRADSPSRSIHSYTLTTPRGGKTRSRVGGEYFVLQIVSSQFRRAFVPNSF